MTLDKVINTYKWNVPYTERDIKEIYSLAYNQAIQDILKLSNGEVINGTLKGMISETDVKELINEVNNSRK